MLLSACTNDKLFGKRLKMVSLISIMGTAISCIALVGRVSAPPKEEYMIAMLAPQPKSMFSASPLEIFEPPLALRLNTQ
jgi:hypothetical protein